MCVVPQSDMTENPRFTRSSESVAFEVMWLRLARKGSIPERWSFHPRSAKVFLRHLLLAQAPSDRDSAIRIRLVGDGVRGHVQGEIVGLNYLDLLEDETHRSCAIEASQELFERPCGRWWIGPVHYERDFSQYWEVTAFPLAGSEGDSAAILALVRPFDAIANRRRFQRKILSLGVPIQCEAIDVHR